MSMRLDDGLAEVVRASNAIEGIFVEPGDPLFDQHLEAVKLVRQHRGIVWPKEIHGALMKGILQDAGQYRLGEMSMVSRSTGEETNRLPRGECVEELMKQYLDMVVQLVWRHDGGHLRMSPREIERMLFDLHAHGLCIHPFTDGNGRTFRIFWNQLRLHFGFSWLVIVPPPESNAVAVSAVAPILDKSPAAPAFDYVGEIRKYEDMVFRTNYPHVY